MSYTPYYISDFEEETGLETYHEPFLVPEKAFPVLEDAFVWRGKVKKREGFTHLGRLRRTLKLAAIGNISSATLTYNIFTLMGLLATEPNAELQPGSVASPLIIDIAGGITITDTLGDGTTTIAGTVLITSATIHYPTGVLTLAFAGAFGPSAATFSGAYYPMLPVMGLRRQETSSINDETFIAFDTKYAYLFAFGLFDELVPGTTWTGSDSDFFWSVNYWNDPTVTTRKLFWVTNFNTATPDPIRYFNTVAWANFAPMLAAGVAVPRRLTQCRILVAYKNRLVAMNTYERAAGGASYVAYQNRIRFSQAGTPLTEGAIGVGPAFAWTTVSAWAEDVPGKGGYIDLPTSEQIVTAEFIKDTLLVKCERSSYKLIYTGIPSTPFIYEKINTELGAESTFSKIPFDNGVLTVGNNGVTVDDSISVVRIDRKIPDFAFAIHNAQEGVKRVHGIRDYFYELALWTYPSISTQAHFPDKILVYNYKNQSFAEFNDSFTCFGYYQRLLDLTWADLPYLTWSDWSITWKSGKAQSKFPDIIGGNQQGYVSVLSQQGLNGISLSLKAIDGTVSPTELTIPNHNLQTGMFIKITDVISDAGPPDYAAYFNNQIFKVVRVDQDRISLFFSPDPFDVVDLGVGGTYIGCGHVSVINNFNVTTKMFAPFYEQGGQARLGHVDFLLQTTSDGELSSNILIDECDSVSLTDPTSTDGNLGTFVLLTQPENTTLIPFQAGQDKIWHRQYVQAICQNFQIQLSMNDTQMFFENIAASDFVLHALVLYVSKNARLVQ